MLGVVVDSSFGGLGASGFESFQVLGRMFEVCSDA